MAYKGKRPGLAWARVPCLLVLEPFLDQEGFQGVGKDFNASSTEP